MEKRYREVAQEGKDTWIGLRLASKCATWCVGGIYQRGALDYLLDPDVNEFERKRSLKVRP